MQAAAESVRNSPLSGTAGIEGVVWALPAVWLIASLLMSVPALWPGFPADDKGAAAGILMPHLWLSLLLNLPLALSMFAGSRAESRHVALAGVWLVLQLAIALGFYGGYLGVDAIAAGIAGLNYILLALTWIAAAWLAVRGADGWMVLVALLAVVLAIGGGVAVKAIGASPSLMQFSAMDVSLLLGLVLIAAWGRRFAPTGASGVSAVAWMGLSMLFVAGLIADRVVLTLGADAEEAAAGLPGYWGYGVAAALGALVALPTYVWFALTQRRALSQRYRDYRQVLEGDRTYEQIELAHQSLADALTTGARRLLLVHLGVSAVLIVSASWLLQTLRLDPLWLGILRFAALGAVFYLPTLLIVGVMLWARRTGAALVVLLIYLVANAGLSLLSLRLGFAWYGWGQAVAAMLAFATGIAFYGRYVAALPYHYFVGEGALFGDKQPNGPLTPGESRG